MTKESYLDTLRHQYTDDIKEAYFECQHQLGAQIDIPQLNERLEGLIQSASFEGLSPSDFDELVRSILPDLHSKLHYLTKAKARTHAPPRKRSAA